MRTFRNNVIRYLSNWSATMFSTLKVSLSILGSSDLYGRVRLVLSRLLLLPASLVRVL